MHAGIAVVGFGGKSCGPVQRKPEVTTERQGNTWMWEGDRSYTVFSSLEAGFPDVIRGAVEKASSSFYLQDSAVIVTNPGEVDACGFEGMCLVHRMQALEADSKTKTQTKSHSMRK
jgi:hypothetical protein